MYRSHDPIMCETKMGQLNDENYRISKNNELLVRAVSDHQQRVQELEALAGTHERQLIALRNRLADEAFRALSTGTSNDYGKVPALSTLTAASLTQLSSDTRHSFLQSLEVGNFVDCWDAGIWRVAQIKIVKPDEVQVRFEGWGGDRAVWVPRQHARLAPWRSHTGPGGDSESKGPPSLSLTSSSGDITLVRRSSLEPSSPQSSSGRSRSSSATAADAARIVELESNLAKLRHDNTKLAADAAKWRRIVTLSTGVKELDTVSRFFDECFSIEADINAHATATKATELSELHKRLLSLRANLAHANESLRTVTAITIATPSSVTTPGPRSTPSPSASPRLLPTSSHGLSVAIPPSISLTGGGGGSSSSHGRTPSSSPGGIPTSAPLTVSTTSSSSNGSATSNGTVTASPNFTSALACHMYVTVAAQLAAGFSEFLASQVAELQRADVARGEDAYQRSLHRIFIPIDVPADGNCLFGSVAMGEMVRTALVALSSALPPSAAPLVRTNSGGAPPVAVAVNNNGATTVSASSSVVPSSSNNVVVGEATWIAQAERLRTLPASILRTASADTRQRTIVAMLANIDRYIPLIEREILYALEESHHDATSVAIRTKFVAVFHDLFTASPAAKGDTRILLAARSRQAAQIYADVMTADRVFGQSVELEVLADSLRVPIHIYYGVRPPLPAGVVIATVDDPSLLTPSRVFGASYAAAPPIYLSYAMAAKHYSLLLPRQYPLAYPTPSAVLPSSSSSLPVTSLVEAVAAPVITVVASSTGSVPSSPMLGAHIGRSQYTGEPTRFDDPDDDELPPLDGSHPTGSGDKPDLSRLRSISPSRQQHALRPPATSGMSLSGGTSMRRDRSGYNERDRQQKFAEHDVARRSGRPVHVATASSLSASGSSLRSMRHDHDVSPGASSPARRRSPPVRSNPGSAVSSPSFPHSIATMTPPVVHLPPTSIPLPLSAGFVSSAGSPLAPLLPAVVPASPPRINRGQATALSPIAHVPTAAPVVTPVAPVPVVRTAAISAQPQAVAASDPARRMVINVTAAPSVSPSSSSSGSLSAELEALHLADGSSNHDTLPVTSTWINHSHSSHVRAADRTLGSEAYDPSHSSYSALPLRSTTIADRTVSLAAVADAVPTSVKLIRLQLYNGSAGYHITWPVNEPVGGMIDDIARQLKLSHNSTHMELRRRNPAAAAHTSATSAAAAAGSYLPIPRYLTPITAGLKDNDQVFLFISA